METKYIVAHNYILLQGHVICLTETFIVYLSYNHCRIVRASNYGIASNTVSKPATHKDTTLEN